MTKKEAREMERLRRMLAAETERAEKAWVAYRETLHKLVDAQQRLDAVVEALDVPVAPR